ncbi:snake venom 5'-nucleotidase-like [Amphiura filiformis]|uniref:snake venom 5'-nucleotidase-like n=1 Tax=Amphiura filiformis TaxID=82378 RepID=UPI003B226DDA
MDVIYNTLAFLLFVTTACLCDAKANEFQLTILHTSTVTSAFEQFNSEGAKCSEQEAANGKCLGGVARRGTAIKDVRKERHSDLNVLLLDGGDQFVGEWYNYYEGNATAHFMNALEYDAMAIGNLEFTHGPDGLASFLKQARFNAVCSNLDVSEEPVLQGLFHKSVIKTIGGERIGIVGYTTQKTNEISQVRNANFTDAVQSVQEEVNVLRSQGINKIIVLGHTYGWIEDGNEALEIALHVPEVDIIVLGGANLFQCNDCSHVEEDMIEGFKEDPTYPMEIMPKHDSTERVLLVNGYLFGRYLGRLNVNFIDGKLTQWNGDPIRLDNTIKEDPSLLAEINAYADEIENAGNRLLGNTVVMLQGGPEWDQACRRRECNMGNLVADTMLWEYRKSLGIRKWSDVSMAVINAGAIRASIDKGEIRVRDVHEVLPFGNTFDAVEIKGKYIREMLEHSAAGYEDYSGRFLQVSGMRVTYNMTRDPYKNRVVKVMLKCIDCTTTAYQPLEDERVYKMAVSSFMRGGGDGYGMIKDNSFDYKIGDSGEYVMADYIRLETTISIGLEGRIRLGPDERKHSPKMVAFYVVIAVACFFILSCIVFTLIYRKRRQMKNAGSSSYLNLQQQQNIQTLK